MSMKSEDVWQCDGCGCTTFKILRDGYVVCVDCDSYFPAARIMFTGETGNIEQPAIN